MTEHDPMCPARKIRPDLRGTLLVYSLCQCALITRVRDDERRQMEMAAAIDREEIADEVRESIAREIEVFHAEQCGGPESPWSHICTCSYAARIARDGTP